MPHLQGSTDAAAPVMKGVNTMKKHIEYDDFGEYIEYLEEMDETRADQEPAQ